jgi:hypothetical protein
VIANRWGEHLVRSGHELKVDVPPLHAVADVQVGYAHLGAVAIGVAMLAVLPRVVSHAPWQTVLAVAFLAAGVWTVAVNATRGGDGLLQGIDNRHEYLADVDAVGSPMSFLRHFTDDFGQYATHTRGHPPGFVLVLWTLDAVGLRGAVWAASLFIAGGALAVPAVLVAVRDIAGEAVARAGAPFVAVAPVALWVGSSADAFLAGVGALAVAVLVRAVVRPDRAALAAVVGGVLFGGVLLLSYGSILLAVIPASVALRLRRGTVLVPAAIAAGLVVVVAFGVGFNYLDGLARTRAAYFDGVASHRPYSYALLANLAALAIAVGPAVVIGLTRTRGKLTLLVGAAVAAVALADVSGMSKLEVERIWLPFAVWLLPAAAVLSLPRATMGKRWLGLQMLFTLAIQTSVRTGW